MSSADAPGDLPAVGALTVRDAGGEKGKGKGAPPEPEASAADGDETSGKQSEGSDAAPTAAKPSLKPLTDEQRAKITTQVEFYFSDANLPTDAFLLKKVKADPEGWVPIGVVCGFNRMKQLLKKHPPAATVAAIVAERSRVLVVDETLGKIRRAEPLPDFDLEDIQARTVVAENLGAEPTVEGVAKAFTLDVENAENASTTENANDVQKTNDDVQKANENVPNAAILKKNATRSMVPPSMVRVRHPGMQTPAGVCAATTGLDLVRVASGATHALIEYATRELAELAVRLKNDDKDWRHGLRVRLLVKNVKAAAKKKKQREERAQRLLASALALRGVHRRRRSRRAGGHALDGTRPRAARLSLAPGLPRHGRREDAIAGCLHLCPRWSPLWSGWPDGRPSELEEPREVVFRRGPSRGR